MAGVGAFAELTVSTPPIVAVAFVAANDASGDLKNAAQVLFDSGAYGDLVQVCDGTADQSEINTAYAALASDGGELVLSDGTFNVTGKCQFNNSNTIIRMLGGGISWSNAGSTDVLISVEASNIRMYNIRVEGSGQKGNGIGLMLGGEVSTVHGVAVYGLRALNLNIGLDFGIVDNSSTGDCIVSGYRISNCQTGIRSRAFVNWVDGGFISGCDISVQQTDDRHSGKIVMTNTALNQHAVAAIDLIRGRGSVFDNVWIEHSDDQGTASPVAIRIGNSTHEYTNPTFGYLHIHLHDGTNPEVYGFQLRNCTGFYCEHAEFTDEITTNVQLVRTESDFTGTARFRKISIGDSVPANYSYERVLDHQGSGDIIIEAVPEESGNAGDVVGEITPAGCCDYTVGKRNSTYFGKKRNGHLDSVDTNLKTVIDAIKASNTSFHFTSGSFDYGTMTQASDRTTFADLTGMLFEGEGIDVTTITVDGASLAEDTEVFSMTRCDKTTIRDMTCVADGDDRQSSDAIDFDDSDECIIERVKITNSRGDCIIFDGKNGQAINNTIRYCILTGSFDAGIEMLSADRNLIYANFIYSTGDQGIQLNADAGTSTQSERNVVVNNIIYGPGGDGIQVRSSSFNIVAYNQCWNAPAARAGIDLVTGIAGENCDGNVVIGNICSDDQGTKTQDYGIRMDPDAASEANDNIIAFNYVKGNDLANIQDNGSTNTQWFQNIGGIGRGERRTLSGTLSSGAQNAFAFTAQNPENVAVAIVRVLVDVTTAGGTAGALIDVGSAANSSTGSDNLIDGADINTQALYDNIDDQGSNGASKQRLDENGGSTDWVTGQIVTADANSLAGNYVLEYVALATG